MKTSSDDICTRSIPWQEPLAFAHAVPQYEQNWALFYSGAETDYTGRYSYLVMRPYKSIISEHFDEIEEQLRYQQTCYPTTHRFLHGWFGYLGYGLRHTVESLPEGKPSSINLPRLWLIQYQLVLVFDHHTHELMAYSRDEALFDAIPSFPSEKPFHAHNPCKVLALHSNMSKEEYLSKVCELKELIDRGVLYQANLTRKFYGVLDPSCDPVLLFSHLCRVSPSPYSAFLKFGNSYIISSSPEQFLTIDEEGVVTSRPIKGTASRLPQHGKEDDAIARYALQESQKDRAENLMITDLVRNDFSRTCDVGSVSVPELFKVTTYPHLHHLASTIQGKKSKEYSEIELIQGCFPPGSMTGAPKVKAMELCHDLEQEERGVYSGAIGWLGGDGSVDLSVVIRTLLLEDNRFEFQVGGAIVADSVPEKEWEETLVKARAIADILNLSPYMLESL